ncbi:DUF4386 domain-containing protein [uncultured Serinicoccus sp.]|uniref:DUF4386 domain-containing protein n=1 Tax=uncultured Serinicoccus sp. TaxID=735514 RepID=UPI0026043EBB|nr:DUF4386 domain-containing protein [uncultured Serinicoccus sp.]
MTTTTSTPPQPAAPGRTAPPLATARTTGWLYLGLGVTGMLGFLLIRPRVVGADGASTVELLTAHETLARVGVVAYLGTVVTQVLVALWFFRLFRRTDAFVASTLTTFGLFNASVVLASAAASATALDLTPLGPQAAGEVHALTTLAENLWGVGAVFFGLWLLPMGMLALRVGMPRPLGWVLLVGGGGYVVSSVLGYLLPDAALAAALLTVPATVGEFWMIGYLLHGGVFRRAA